MPVVFEAPKDLSPELREQADRLLADLQRLHDENPLHRFHVCESFCGEPGCEPRPKQRRFMAAETPIQAAFAGNRFGKSATGVVKCFIQHLPDELIPERLREFKIAKSAVVQGRILCPSEQVMEDTLLPTMKQWIPRAALLGGSWEKAWDKSHSILRFADGGRIGVYTYRQDPETMEGGSLDYVLYDEPPPESIRNACLSRLADRDGFEMFAMTPVNMKGGGIGWIYRKIWKRREAPDVTVVKGSGYDNPAIPKEALRRILEQFPEEERQAREHGDFMHVGGMVYAGGFEGHLVPPLSPEQLRGRDIVVGIDPGMKCAPFVWIAFDEDNRAVVFDEVALSGATVVDYMLAIVRTNAKWGIATREELATATKELKRRAGANPEDALSLPELLEATPGAEGPMYVIDPSARNRSLTNAESVQGELERQGIYPIPGQNSVFAGVSQVRRRLQQGGLFICENCVGLRDEAEEYRLKDRPDGEFEVVKEDDHRLDAMRYALMARPWYATDDSPPKGLGWVPGRAPNRRRKRVEHPPTGAYT